MILDGNIYRTKSPSQPFFGVRREAAQSLSSLWRSVTANKMQRSEFSHACVIRRERAQRTDADGRRQQQFSGATTLTAPPP